MNEPLLYIIHFVYWDSKSNTNSFGEGGIFVQYVKSIKYLFIVYPQILLAPAVLEGRKSVTSFKRDRLKCKTIMNDNKSNLLSLTIN